MTIKVKEAFEFAFASIGGEEALAGWAKDNPSEFYKLFARLLPSRNELTGSSDGEPKFAEHSDEKLEAMILERVYNLGILKREPA